MNYAVSVVFLHRPNVNLSPVYFMKNFEQVFKTKLWFDFVIVSQSFSVLWLIRHSLLLTEISFPWMKGHYTVNDLIAGRPFYRCYALFSINNLYWWEMYYLLPCPVRTPSHPRSSRVHCPHYFLFSLQHDHVATQKVCWTFKRVYWTVRAIVVTPKFTPTQCPSLQSQVC